MSLIILLEVFLNGLMRNFNLSFLKIHGILYWRIFHLFILKKAAQLFNLMWPWVLLVVWLVSSRNFINAWINSSFFLAWINNIYNIFIFILKWLQIIILIILGIKTSHCYHVIVLIIVLPNFDRGEKLNIIWRLIQQVLLIYLNVAFAFLFYLEWIIAFIWRFLKASLLQDLSWWET